MSIAPRSLLLSTILIASTCNSQPEEVTEPLVLDGARTGSSGEVLALAFIGRAVTRTFGLPTAGLTTSNRPIPLADNAILNLASGVMTDGTGRASK